MEYRKLGNTNENVSVICLGTMTYGEQNTEQEAHEQLDIAIDNGINFIDTAELYPVPPKKETYGATEKYIGSWLTKQNNREKVILATKIAGKSAFEYIREGKSKFDRKNLTKAVDDSLSRLQTDYIDLYQLHWPERRTNFFGQLGYKHTFNNDFTPIEETLETLNDFVKQGKIKYIGISNETPWGTMKFLEVAKQKNYPQIVSVQNPYNLLNRTYEIGMAEIFHRESVGLLAYSPLAFGVLSGKYLENRAPSSRSRLIRFKSHFSRYTQPIPKKATEEYVTIAKRHGISPTQMALSYVNTRTFLTSNIIGATTKEQLLENIGSIDVKLSPEILSEIEKVHTAIPNPAP